MDTSKMMLTEAVSPPIYLERGNGREFARIISGNKATQNSDSTSEVKRIQAAKDFESLLLSRLLNEMKDTIGNWGFEKDGVSRQIHGIFWSFIARDISNKGGLGIWKQIYESINDTEKLNIKAKEMDSKI